MPTRHRSSSAEEEEDDDEEVIKPTNSKKAKGDHDESTSASASKAKAKDTKSPTSGPKQGEGEEVSIEKNEEGDPFFKLSESRRLTVRKFKGKVLVDMREMYKDKSSGQMKPGSKGISLSKEQWDLIKSNIDSVDDMIANIAEK